MDDKIKSAKQENNKLKKEQTKNKKINKYLKMKINK